MQVMMEAFPEIVPQPPQPPQQYGMFRGPSAYVARTPWNPVAGVFSFNGVGFVAGATELYLDTIPLTALALGALPGAGEFSIAVALTSISFRPPPPIAPGTYFVRLRVNGVEGPAVGRIVLP